MDTLTFKVVPEEGGELSAEKAGQIMEDVQNVLSDIGMFIVTAEMGLQGKAPESFRSMFDLSAEPRSRRGGEISVLEVALSKLENILDVAGSEIINRWLSENYTDPRYRAAVAKGLMKLCRDLEGNNLSYGQGRRMKNLLNPRSERFQESACVDTKMFTCVLAGVVCNNGMRGRKTYYIDSGDRKSKITVGRDFSEKTAAYYSGNGPCLVSGMAVLDDDDNVLEVRDVCGMSDFPGIIFKRIITPDLDIALLNPISADVSFDRAAHKWTLSNDIIGISVSKSNWNDTVVAFHDYFIFLWETYVEEPKGDLSDEEVEIRDYLLSLVPF